MLNLPWSETWRYDAEPSMVEDMEGFCILKVSDQALVGLKYPVRSSSSIGSFGFGRYI